MGTDDFFKKRKMSGRQPRKSKNLSFRSVKWLLISEGTVTEPIYFAYLIGLFKNRYGENMNIELVAKGKGKNTVSLVESVNQHIVGNIMYEKVFVVFDKDSFSNHNFNNAINLALKSNYICLWSNQCIELWFLLHHIYFDSDIDRSIYYSKLSNLMGNGPSYGKDNENIISYFQQLHLDDLKSIKKAYGNSIKLYNNHSKLGVSYCKMSPCTTVFMFIQEIEKSTGINFISDN